MKPNEHRTVNGSRGYIISFSSGKTIKTDITELSYLVRIMDHPVALKNWLGQVNCREEEEVVQRVAEITQIDRSSQVTKDAWWMFRQAIFNFYCEYVAKEFAPFI